MTKRNWFNTLGLSKHISLRGFALIFLALTQVPVAIKTTAEIYCIEKLGQEYNSAVVAIVQCNGGK